MKIPVDTEALILEAKSEVQEKLEADIKYRIKADLLNIESAQKSVNTYTKNFNTFIEKIKAATTIEELKFAIYGK